MTGMRDVLARPWAAFARACGARIGRGSSAACAVSSRFPATLFGRGRAAVLCLLLGALAAPWEAEGASYTTMGNDRILLMNNWTKGRVSIVDQGYYDTDVTAKTYWTHTGNLHRTLSTGTNHVMRTSGGDVWWQLFDCRAGSAANLSGGNSVPTSGYSLPSGSGRSVVAETAAITLRNTLGAQVFSPYYKDGIGTIYFDIVNVFSKASADTPTVKLEIATNVLEEVSEDLASSTDPAELDWHAVPMTVLPVQDFKLTGEIRDGVTDLELKAPGAGGSNYFYRVRATLNCRVPARFRIRRTTIDTTEPTKTADDIGLITLDNVVASFPAMSFNLHTFAPEYDRELTGSEVLGVIGDLNSPFLSSSQEGVGAHAYFEYLTNGASRVVPSLSNAKFHYRWRYLNQSVGTWKELPMGISDTTQLVAQVGSSIALGEGVGDLEYYFTADVSSVFFSCLDYTFGNPLGWGVGWSEEISSITNRATYTEEDNLPSCGTDYFVRIREGQSSYEWVKLCASVTTNGTAGTKDETVRMELVGDNTWRYHYFIPTNSIGETLRFHFEGKELYTNEVAFTYHSRTNVWYSDLSDGVPYLPYTSVAGPDYGYEAAVKLDPASTHLLIEFNDRLNSFSVSHATYQNFNMWTDAQAGFRGNAKWNGASPTNDELFVEGTAASGVSDAKRTFTADMVSWPVSKYYDDLWREPFEGVEVDDLTYRYNLHQSVTTTPNGWNAENGSFVRGSRMPFGDRDGKVWKSLAWEMDGEGKGTISLVKKAVTGVGKVSFSARVSQTPRFDSFATYLDGTANKNYAISAQLTMSRLYDSKNAPLDISPCQPSVSLVGYKRGTKGCYELRFTRSDETKLTAGLYKWTQINGEMVATLLTSNVLSTASSGASAGPAPDGGKQTTFNSFNNLLVPTGSDFSKLNNEWTSALFSLYTTGDGKVMLDGWLSNARNTSNVSQDKANLKHVIKWTDADPGSLTRGSYGVGSCDCQAAFGGILYHEFSADTYTGQEANLNGVNLSGSYQYGYFDDDWELMYDRWRRLAKIPGSTSWESTVWTDTGLSAVIPTNQTVQLYVAEATGASQKNWVPVEGCTASVASFATNTISFMPYTTADAYVQLRSGPGVANVTVGNIEVEAWAAQDRGTENYSYSTEWTYTHGTVESAVKVEGGNVEVQSAGTNGYVYIFTTAGNTIEMVPQMDMTLDRLLLVGGGGAGGWTIGAGGGGGGVLSYDWTAAPAIVPKGTTVRVVVGKGGSAQYNASNASTNWKRGQNGGDSYVVNIPGKTTAHAAGGGGGGSWNEQAGNGAGTGGGSAQNNSTQAAGSQGGKGGRGNVESPGGGGGASGENGQDGIPTSDGLATGGQGSDGKKCDGQAGKGGDGKMDDITGKSVYYGGGGGGGAGNSCAIPGKGGLGGGGDGAARDSRLRGTDGTDGLGGGGGGGSHSPATCGGEGGRGAVIMRVRTAPVVCTLQPARGGWEDEDAGTVHPMGLRSPFLENGMSMISFTYSGANSNCVLWLQVCTNCADASFASGYTTLPPNDSRGLWQTKAVWMFPAAAKGVKVTDPSTLPAGAVVTNLVSEADMAAGTLSYYQSLRAPIKGLMRLVVAPEVLQHAIADQGPGCDVDYGKITISKIYCYDEPQLDMRSWWGWNIHTEGWNTKSKDYAYLTDSPNGLSGALNFSALEKDNKSKAANGIGLGEENIAQYAENNPFIQCPPLTNGIGTVSFRARTFTNEQECSSWVTLYGSSEPDAYQLQDPDMWVKLQEFEITNNTYQTYMWKTNSDSTALQAIRLEVNAARLGRSDSDNRGYQKPWEKPQATPIQRVFLDEISVSEPIVPRLVFRDVRPFRSAQLRQEAMIAVSNVTSMSEQPITGESWGLQATVEPQQMSDELDVNSLRVFASFKTGLSPWGYAQWGEDAQVVELPRMGTNLVFRSHMSRPETIQAPLDAYNTVQFMVWVEYKDRSGGEHTHYLDSSEWSPPSWYYGIDDLNKTYGGGLGDRFSAYTIFDSISPKRAWVNEVNYRSTPENEAEDRKAQFIEFAVPQHADLTGWSLEITGNEQYSNTVLAVFGYDDAKVTVKDGTSNGVDYTNNYVFVALRSPGTTDTAIRNNCDGVWKGIKDVAAHIDDNGVLRSYEPYGVALVRPSGVIEHQVIVEGRNSWEESDYEFLKYLYSGTNMTAQIRSRYPSSQWFFAGREEAEGTLGVYRGHGEDATCWTNKMISTPGRLNQMADGTLQDIDPDWFLKPNGTNVWIYAHIKSPFIEQEIAGVKSRTTQVIVLSKGFTTNIVYHVDPWYAIGTCTTNGVEVAGARGRGSAQDTPKHQYTLNLGRVEENITVEVGEQASQIVMDAGLRSDDPYYPAVMDWLTRIADEDSTIHQAEYWPLSARGRPANPTKLDIKDMYWLDINPTQPDWVLIAGMGSQDAATIGSDACMPKVVQDLTTGEDYTNVVVTVTMMITNQTKDVSKPYYGVAGAHAPMRLQGLEPGSTSEDYRSSGSNNWISCTFKITGALQKPGYTDKFYPLRWFVFGPDSFDENFQAKIEIQDPFLPYSVGRNYGWPVYRNQFPIFFKWRLDGDGPGNSSAEMLKADSTYP